MSNFKSAPNEPETATLIFRIKWNVFLVLREKRQKEGVLKITCLEVGGGSCAGCVLLSWQLLYTREMSQTSALAANSTGHNKERQELESSTTGIPVMRIRIKITMIRIL